MNFSKLFSIVALSFLIIACSSNDDSNDDQNESNEALIGSWFRESTEDQDGMISDDSQFCMVTEFTSDLYIVTEYSGVDCSIEFGSGSIPYTLVGDKVYLGDVSLDIYHEIVLLNETTLKLKQDYSDNQGNTFYDIVTYSKME